MLRSIRKHNKKPQRIQEKDRERVNKMNRRYIKTLTAFALTGALIVFSLTGCGSADENTSESGSSAAGDVQTVKIGVPGDFDKISYLDENGELVGFEIDLFKAIDEELPQYDFEYEPSTFDNILIELDTGKIDMIVNECGYNDERAQKYDFSNPYSYKHLLNIQLI